MTARRQTPRRVGALTLAVVLVAAILSASSGPAAAAKGGRAAGTVDFSCVLAPMDQSVDWTAKVAVAGKKAKRKPRTAALTGKVGKLLGIAPRPVSGEITATLTLKVGTRRTTLTGTRGVDVAAGEPIALPRLTGRVKVPRGNLMLPVVVTGLELEVAAYGGAGTSGTCTPVDGGTLSALTLR